MNITPGIFIKIKLRGFLVFFLIGLSGCDYTNSLIFSGYSYGDFVYLALSETGKVDTLLVNKGDRVKAGQVLVKMESFTAENALKKAEKNYQAEIATLRNMQSGERPAELNVIRSQLKKARSAANLAKNQLERYQALFRTKVVSATEWESAREDYAQKQALVDELLHQLEAKQLPSRQAEIQRQQALVESAKVQRDKADWDLRQLEIVAPQAAQVFDILYRPGERPAAGRPIVSLLPEGNVKMRFFVPEKIAGALKTGMKVRIYFDGYSGFVPGLLNYISPEAEYTPPVIYSSKRREKLLFMVEAVPEYNQQASLVKPGLPVRVEIVTDDPVLH
ncbi:HlyD family secretion protein [Erwinia psidii]|uniref:HlyD family efflux transporter periplasmic adaptor subunit n=1 Tax=Erwinia psidii TaxID=69224 RepID=A0A3N6TPV2_9GAMM|nr:HlyD family efflux transporter periplasmic adaptor subunit [Erwinia psidii]MCX8959132.1 HlyD family efflux transporter periplasmic adaptor subunit [Erwinia psidii]MCX8962250.1 HlyD family efflux transporter periplasmic adaptor subunit [Erwinia psidii]MCX8966888.1 HlyD family efflux transporter periplasmic adaptor subunit [Erwinia psidii]RQM37262.1 HlyD family efflux transporter periplasmic adaptor subunit [Erwinia psidii]